VVLDGGGPRSAATASGRPLDSRPMSEPGRPLLQRSVNTERALTAPRPRLRGRSHLVAAAVAVPAALAAVVLAPAGVTRAGVTTFAVGVTAMFCASALLHLRRWSPGTYERLFRLDHTGIYLAIGGTGAALALLGFDGWPGQVLLGGVVVGTVLGIVVEWMPFAPPRGFSNTVYLTLGWLPILLLPWLWTTSGVAVVVLLLFGGVLYTSGAIIVALQRPDPSPTWFGYHELFHLLVILAVLAHAGMVLLLAIPGG
jgi:hemolysin III